MSVYNIPNFVDAQDSTKEYKYKILVYPNITYQKEIDAIIQINLNKPLINDKKKVFRHLMC